MENMQISDTVKAITLQTANNPSQQTDPQLESIMQSLLIQDTDLMRILKGEIHEYLNTLEKQIVWLQQESAAMTDFYKQTHEQTAAQIGQFQMQLGEVQKQLQAIESQVKRYRRYVPYLLLFTSNSVLSNISAKEADILIRKIDIMIMRDRLDCTDDETALEDINFFDAIKVRLILHIKRNIEGFTFRGLIEEKKTVTNVISDATSRGTGRKKILGLI